MKADEKNYGKKKKQTERRQAGFLALKRRIEA